MLDVKSIISGLKINWLRRLILMINIEYLATLANIDINDLFKEGSYYISCKVAEV